MAKTLTVLFNLYFTKEIFLDKLKVIKIVPLFRKGILDIPENHRLISIITMLGKVFEIILK